MKLHNLEALDQILISFLNENADNIVEAKVLARDVKTVVSALNVVPAYHMHDAAQLFTDTLRQWSDQSLQYLAGNRLRDVDAVSKLEFLGVDPKTGMGILDVEVKLDFFDVTGEISDMVSSAFQQGGIASKHAVKDAFATASTKKTSGPEAKALVGIHKFSATSSSSALRFTSDLRRLTAGALEQRAKYFGPKVVGNIIRRHDDPQIAMWRPMKAVSSTVDDDVMMLSLVVACVPRKSMPKSAHVEDV